MAAALTFGPHTLLAATPAALLHGWLRFPSPELFVLTPTQRAPRDGITPIHRSRPVHYGFIDHIPVTGPEQTILDCASTVRSDKGYRRIVRQSQVDGATTHARLVAFAALNKGSRGVARLKRELEDGPSPTRSANEDRVLDLIRHGGEPLVNHVIGEDEFDLVYLDQRVIVGIDGPVHENPTAKADDAAKQDRAEALGFVVYRLS